MSLPPLPPLNTGSAKGPDARIAGQGFRNSQPATGDSNPASDLSRGWQFSSALARLPSATPAAVAGTEAGMEAETADQGLTHDQADGRAAVAVSAVVDGADGATGQPQHLTSQQSQALSDPITDDRALPWQADTRSYEAPPVTVYNLAQSATVQPPASAASSATTMPVSSVSHQPAVMPWLAAPTAGASAAQPPLQPVTGVLSGLTAQLQVVDNRTDGQAPLLAGPGAGSSEWSTIRLGPRPEASGSWGRELAAALGDRLTMQVTQGVREANVRLDPPELGRIDLMVRMDGDRLQIQLNATSPQVRDMLLQTADRLRAELQEQGGQTVEVNVGQQDQEHRQHPGRDAAAGIAGNRTPAEDEQHQLTTAPMDTVTSARWISTQA